MSYNNNNQRPQGKEEVFNKVKFSSVKLGETKQGSPTMGLYLKRDQMEKLHTLITELLQANEDGMKLGCIVIQGEKYDSGYAYVNPKEKKEDKQGAADGEDTTTGKAKGGFGKKSGGFGKDGARSYFQNKRV